MTLNKSNYKKFRVGNWELGIRMIKVKILKFVVVKLMLNILLGEQNHILNTSNQNPKMILVQ
ncbi:MAG: hypothetical protein DRR19_01250 [Candidatus Parabeggiatoa sp. nov. 1]|nr:MAG: hypothetical protein DRR19_01250 [Gammaproteobacteria bacterium]